MRKLTAFIAVLSLILCLSGNALASVSVTTPATGYTCAEDVEYKIVSGIVVNWGARGETCSFLSPSALNYYYAPDADTWTELSGKDGGTGTSDAYTSQLYKDLQSLMQTRHTNLQGYQDTRQYYQYTDCANNDSSLISSFYTGKTVASVWTGQTYNREHVWPKSKCINTNKAEDSADIMMLRATITSENSSRGNSAYGESSGYFDPGASVRGDCARMVLYGYVRWGNTDKMWGSSGVIENLDILLKWMEEDPVDTWEMGRNDSVQSITGVRNVFVDYPEFAWLLFGQEIPADMVTPSGNAAADAPHTHSYTATITPPTCAAQGFTTHSCVCGDSYTDSYTDAVGHLDSNSDRICDSCGEQLPCGHANVILQNAADATCDADGYTGDKTCADCGELLGDGSVIPATEEHKFSDWISNDTLSCRTCTVCGLEEIEYLPTTKPSPEPTLTPTPTLTPEPEPDAEQNGAVTVIVCAAAVTLAAGCVAVGLSVRKKNIKRRHG